MSIASVQQQWSRGGDAVITVVLGDYMLAIRHFLSLSCLSPINSFLGCPENCHTYNLVQLQLERMWTAQNTKKKTNLCSQFNDGVLWTANCSVKMVWSATKRTGAAYHVHRRSTVMVFGKPTSGLMVEIQPPETTDEIDHFLILWGVWAVRARQGIREDIWIQLFCNFT